jgi:hypothetical protein
MGQGSNDTYNLVSIVFIVLAVVAFVVGILFLSGAINPPSVLQVPTEVTPEPPIAIVALPGTNQPAPTTTFEPLPTREASATPSPFPSYTPSDTPRPTNTLTPTVTITPTTTLTFTPSFTPTLTETLTLTPTPTVPTATPTNTPYPIEFQRESTPIIYRPSVNGLVCNWQGIGGTVASRSGAPLTGYPIRVTSSTGVTIAVANSGSNTNPYGVSGWEITVGSAAEAGTYFVEILSQDGSGAPISNPIQVNFTGSCDGNLALVNFIRIAN